MARYNVCADCYTAAQREHHGLRDKRYAAVHNGLRRLRGETREEEYTLRPVTAVAEGLPADPSGCQCCGVGRNDLRDQERYGHPSPSSEYYGPYAATCQIEIPDYVPSRAKVLGLGIFAYPQY